MLHRPLCSFVAALFLTAAPGIAQIPAGSPGSALVASKNWIFVLHEGVLYKFDQRSLRLLGSVNLDAARPATVEEVEVIAEEPPMPAERIDVTETVEEVVEEVVEEPADRRSPVAGVDRAVERGLQWLIAHQDEDGKWDADAFMKHDAGGPPCDGAGNPTKDVGVTGLATLALLGNGSTLRFGPHREQIKKAVGWLRDQQQDNGLIGTNAAHDFVYGHAIATMALSEAYGLSRHQALKPVVQNAINYLESHRNPYSVWRYQPRDNDNDTSVTTWAAMAYRSAQSFGIKVNGVALQLVGTWYDQVSDPTGRHGYTKAGERSSRMPGDHSRRFPPENGEAITAAALFGRFLLDQDPATTPIMKASAELLRAKPPLWAAGHIDPYYWWFGTQAMFQMGGEYWRDWSAGLRGVVRAQRNDGNFAGSWDPVGVWDIDGGRIYATALYTLTLEVPRRIARLVR